MLSTLPATSSQVFILYLLSRIISQLLPYRAHTAYSVRLMTRLVDADTLPCSLNVIVHQRYTILTQIHPAVCLPHLHCLTARPSRSPDLVLRRSHSRQRRQEYACMALNRASDLRIHVDAHTGATREFHFMLSLVSALVSVALPRYDSHMRHRHRNRTMVPLAQRLSCSCHLVIVPTSIFVFSALM